EIRSRVRVAGHSSSPDRDRYTRAFDDAVEDRCIAVLRGAGEPEAQRKIGCETVQLPSKPKRARDVLAFDRPGRLEEHEIVVDEAELLARRGALAGRWVEIEIVVDRDRLGVAASVQLAPAPEIDRRVERAVDARREVGLEVGELAPLPREIVVAKAHPARVLARDSCDRARRVEVERERAEVVDYHEVGAVQRAAHDGGLDRARAGRARRCRVNCETRDHRVVTLDSTFDLAGDPSGFEAELVQRPGPLARFDRDAVIAAQPERDGDRQRRHDADDRAAYGTETYARRRFVASRTARETASASCWGRTIAEPDTSCSA